MEIGPSYWLRIHKIFPHGNINWPWPSMRSLFFRNLFLKMSLTIGNNGVRVKSPSDWQLNQLFLPSDLGKCASERQPENERYGHSHVPVNFDKEAFPRISENHYGVIGLIACKSWKFTWRGKCLVIDLNWSFSVKEQRRGLRALILPNLQPFIFHNLSLL